MASLTPLGPFVAPACVQPHLAALGEDVQGQGLLPTVDEVDGLAQAPHVHDGQDGPEDLLLHHRLGVLHVHQHRGGCPGQGSDQPRGGASGGRGLGRRGLW